MKKIMFFRPLYYIGGTEIATLNLIKKLKGYEIYIGYTDETSSEKILNDFKEYATIVNLNKPCDIEFDYFISCSGHFHLVEQIKKVKRKRTLLWIHHFVNMSTTVIANEETCKTMLDGIITVSQNVTDRLIKEFPHTKTLITTIYNVLNVEEIQQKAKKNMKLKLSKELNLVTVARVSMSKGFKRMLELAKYLKEENINFKWFIIGGNYYQDEEKEIKEMFEPYKDNFEWYGFIDNPHKIVKQCDYSVLLSDDETWGLVLTEAMLLGVPCISSDFEVAYEQITDKKNGIILSRDNTEEYKNRIKEIVKYKNKYKRSVKNYKYNNDKIIYKWDNVLNNRNPKLSIIIPNYNKEQYIKDCLDSVTKQTFKNYEVLFIDDCSTDNSLTIASSYNNINIFKTKERLQAGGARNIGLKKAKGEYIVFLDSDDYLTDKYALEKLVNHITDEDLIFINYTKNNFGIISEIKEPKTSLTKKIETTKNLGCPTKVFKRKLIKDMKFAEGKRYEDIMFTLEAMCRTTKYSTLKDSFFTYRKVANSNVTSTVGADAMLDVFEEIAKIYRLCLKYPQYKNELLKRIKKDKLDIRLQAINEIIEFDNNTFNEHFS